MSAVAETEIRSYIVKNFLFGVDDDNLKAEDSLLEKGVIEVTSKEPAILRRIMCPKRGWYTLGGTLAVFSTTADEAIPDDVDALDALPAMFDV